MSLDFVSWNGSKEKENSDAIPLLSPTETAFRAALRTSSSGSFSQSRTSAKAFFIAATYKSSSERESISRSQFQLEHTSFNKFCKREQPIPAHIPCLLLEILGHDC